MSKLMHTGLMTFYTSLVFLACSAIAEETWQVPKTDFGDPDLQVLWTNATITALERPKQFDNLVLSDSQAKEWETSTGDFFDSIDERSSRAY